MFVVGTSAFPIRARYHMAPKQPSRLRVITLANAKGGVGKTTIASALAVRAAEDCKRVSTVLNRGLRCCRTRRLHSPSLGHQQCRRVEGTKKGGAARSKEFRRPFPQ
jgi:AAA domain